MDRNFDLRLWLGVGLLISVLAVNTGIAYQNTRHLDEDARAVAHTYEVLDALADIHATVRESQAGIRGFLLADGDGGYLEPYSEALASQDEQIGRIARLTSDNPNQRGRVARLRKLAAAHFALLDGLMKSFEANGAEAARRSFKAAGGDGVANDLRAVVREMEAEEDRLLLIREPARARAYATAVNSGFVTLAVGLAAVGTVLWLGGRTLRERNRLAAARYQHEFLEATITSLGDGVIVTDTVGRVTVLNRVAQELTGWTQADAAGLPIEAVFNIVHADSRRPVGNPLRSALLQGEVVHLAKDTILLAKDGTEWPLDDSAAPIRAGGGRLAGGVLVFKEISERFRTERELAEAARRQAELLAEVKASEERFHAFMDNTSGIAYMKDEAGRFVYVNRTYADVLGRISDDWRGKTNYDFFPAEDAEIYRAHDSEVLAGDTGVPFTETIAAPDGEKQHWRSFKFPLVDAGGNRLLGGLAWDVTASVNAGVALRQSEERFRSVVEELAEGVVILERVGLKVLRSNQAFLDLLGYTAAELAVLTQYDFVAHDRDDIDGKMDMIEAGGRISIGFRKYRRRDGSLFDVNVSGSVFLLDGQRVICLVVQDMTERVKAENALRDSEAKFRNTVDRLAEGVFVVDAATGRFAEANAAMLEMLGYTASEFAALDPYELVAGERREVYDRKNDTLHIALSDRGRCDVGRREYRRKDGSVFPVDVRVTVVPNGKGTLHAVIARNMTEQTEYENRMQAYQAELERTNARLELLATTDALTGVRNRAAFNVRLSEEFNRAKRHGHSLALLMLDVDHFKAFNDAFGHPAGDGVLIEVAATLKKTARSTDTVARYGGEEFAVILPETDAAGAMVMAERYRRAVAGWAWDKRSITTSIGVAMIGPSVDGPVQLVQAADEALYTSKKNGRNRVQFYAALKRAESAVLST